jgi:heme exporter protein B
MKRGVNAVLRRDLRVELRTPQVVPGMALFSISVFVVFHFALQQRSVEGNLAAGVLWVTLLLADLGSAFVGTLVGALAVQSRARDLVVPLLALPLLIPLLIGAVKLSAPVFGGPVAAARWPAVLALYDLVFGLVAYAVFDFLLED